MSKACHPVCITARPLPPPPPPPPPSIHAVREAVIELASSHRWMVTHYRTPPPTPPPPATFESPSLSVATVGEMQLQPLMKVVTATLFQLCASFFPQSVNRVSLSSLCQCVSFFPLSTVYDSSLCQLYIIFFSLSVVYHSSVSRVSVFFLSVVCQSSFCQSCVSLLSVSRVSVFFLSVVCQSSFCQSCVSLLSVSRVSVFFLSAFRLAALKTPRTPPSPTPQQQQHKRSCYH